MKVHELRNFFNGIPSHYDSLEVEVDLKHISLLGLEFTKEKGTYNGGTVKLLIHDRTSLGNNINTLGENKEPEVTEVSNINIQKEEETTAEQKDEVVEVKTPVKKNTTTRRKSTK